jgi:hypothetical protein
MLFSSEFVRLSGSLIIYLGKIITFEFGTSVEDLKLFFTNPTGPCNLIYLGLIIVTPLFSILVGPYCLKSCSSS